MLDKLFIERKKFLEIIYAGSLGAAALFLRDQPFWIQAILDWLQFSLIFTLFFVAVRDEQRMRQQPRQLRAIKQFVGNWKNLWCVWMMLYTIFAFHNTVEALNNGPLNLYFWSTGLNCAANFFNNLQSYYTFILFLVMTRNTTDKRRNPLPVFAQPFLMAIVVIALVELFFSVLAPVMFQLAVPPKTPHPIHGLIGVASSVLSGLVAGVSFCLFFGRLGSHYIGMRSAWMGALFLYATIQPLYPLFRVFETYPAGDSKEVIGTIQVLLKILAAVLKLVLFLRVREILRNGRLSFFMVRMAKDDKSISAEFQDHVKSAPAETLNVAAASAQVA